uniref:Uncharacterized protein n=1 Tax=Xiphophorus couchianus TaxID=32473 RepID=A0A3B5M9R9_9TELE
MAKSSSRIKMPDSFRVNQPTLSKKTWMGSLQQLSAEPELPFPGTGSRQHWWPSTHLTPPQLCRAWHAEMRQADKSLLVVLPPPRRRGFISALRLTFARSSQVLTSLVLFSFFLFLSLPSRNPDDELTRAPQRRVGQQLQPPPPPVLPPPSVADNLSAVVHTKRVGQHQRAG